MQRSQAGQGACVVWCLREQPGEPLEGAGRVTELLAQVPSQPQRLGQGGGGLQQLLQQRQRALR